MTVNITLAEYMETNSIPEPNSGCHLWLLFTNKRGYGKTNARKWGEQLAHRAAYLAAHGNVPADQLVCHKCDVPSCVNPDHLFLGSHRDNSDDKHRKGRSNMPFGSCHGMAKLTEASVAAIRIDQRSYSALADQFGVSKQTISHVKSGKTWRHVT